jgi:hypothetical protein
VNHLHMEKVVHRDLAVRNILVLQHLFFVLSSPPITHCVPFPFNSWIRTWMLLWATLGIVEENSEWMNLMELTEEKKRFARNIVEDSGRTHSSVGPIRWQLTSTKRKKKDNLVLI